MRGNRGGAVVVGRGVASLQGMGTTFIKLGQFLATRPDIIGEQMAKDLEKLQDKVPAFDLYEAKKVIKKEIGEKIGDAKINGLKAFDGIDW